MDPSLMAFLFGVGTGFLEDQMVTCPDCGHQFPIEETSLIDGKPACPECLEPVDDFEEGEPSVRFGGDAASEEDGYRL
jgi:endogenous inhibitor of DNA gyrase (YacG/DUF329 family)